MELITKSINNEREKTMQNPETELMELINSLLLYPCLNDIINSMFVLILQENP